MARLLLALAGVSGLALAALVFAMFVDQDAALLLPACTSAAAVVAPVCAWHVSQEPRHRGQAFWLVVLVSMLVAIMWGGWSCAMALERVHTSGGWSSYISTMLSLAWFGSGVATWASLDSSRRIRLKSSQPGDDSPAA